MILADQATHAPQKTKHRQRAEPALPSYLVLHRAGFSMPRTLLLARWALTPPFHPYLRGSQARLPFAAGERFPFRPATEAATLIERTGGLVSVALSVAASSRTLPPGVTRRAALRRQALRLATSVSGLSSRAIPCGIAPAIARPTRRVHCTRSIQRMMKVLPGSQ